MGIKNEQIIICKKYNTEIYPVSDVSKIGVAENVKQANLYPINGLRHRPKGDTNGWYIWAGENFSHDKNFWLCFETRLINSSQSDKIPYNNLSCKGFRHVGRHKGIGHSETV
ncbi:immunity protein Imm33 domain-containing protein, partial [Neisseria lactamica]|uniref:immunity protein Imm33 domain-containing protein n=1 Tax=Neisseria lactamica TaxID=486 RepID=UPI001EFDB01A